MKTTCFKCDKCLVPEEELPKGWITVKDGDTYHFCCRDDLMEFYAKLREDAGNGIQAGSYDRESES